MEDEELVEESIVSVTLARALTSLLSATPKKLNDAVSSLSSSSSSSSSNSHHHTQSLEHSLWFLHKYVTDAAHHNHSLDQFLAPIIHNALKCKDSKHGGQAMILLNWLFQDELLFEPVAKGLTSIITRKDDQYLLFGWCVLVRSLVEYENSIHQSTLAGIRERHADLLKVLSTCLPDLAGIVSKGSTLLDGFEFPSRLAVSAADCFLTLSGALTKLAEVQGKKSKLNIKAKDRAITSIQTPTTDKSVKVDSKSSLISMMERNYTLWHHLDELICLVERLLAWSKKSRFLHAKGLEQVLKWLEEIKDHYGSFQNEADCNALKTGDLLLSSCWKHYSMLLHLEDQKFSQNYKELLNQYLSGIEYYMDNHAGGHSDSKDGGETRKFFVNCLCLLLGRLGSKRFESTMLEFGMNISRILVPQLNCTDEDVIVGIVSIFKAIILKPNHSQEDTHTDNSRTNIVVPFLLHLLDERDGTARAVVMLIAEYCLMSNDNTCIIEVLKRLASANISQRRNAMDVISQVIHISSESQKPFPFSAWQDVANKLLERLGDKETVIREQASNLLPRIDPSLYLPALIALVYSSDECQSLASDAIAGVLKHHNQRTEVIFLLLDCLSNISQSLDLPQSTEDKAFSLVPGSKLDTDRVLKLVPEWSKSVEDWNSLIGPLVDKLFADPSNATMVKFLSYISENLANVADLVLHHVLLHAREQKEIGESFLSRWESRSYTSDEFEEMHRSMFEHLCPLLIIKMLPLKTFNDLNSSIVYGHLTQNIGSRNTEIGCECIAALLFNRAFYEFEFEDVRKLSAELCGRIHPQVLFPVVCSVLEQAVDSKNILKIKTCLFSICTSLVVRGRESLYHPSMLAIRRMIETVLLWPCLNSDSVSKAQHGCIDCLALMICAEQQAGELITDSMPKRTSVGKKGNSVINYVIKQFVNEKEITSTPELGDESCEFVGTVPLSFRLCLGNALISACQKISESCKKQFAAQVIPFLLHSLEFEKKSEIRAACIQVLFSAVYHLRSAILPYASDLLKVSLKALKRDSEKERMAGAKLIASLMASEDVIVANISGGLLKARSVLLTISSSDSSPELQQICTKLLACISL